MFLRYIKEYLNPALLNSANRSSKIIKEVEEFNPLTVEVIRQNGIQLGIRGLYGNMTIEAMQIS